MSLIKNYLGIKIDLRRDRLLSEQSFNMLTRDGFYKKKGEKSPQQSFARAATAFSFGDMQLAQDIYDHISQLNFMYASPVLSTAPVIEWPYKGKSYNTFKKNAEWLENNHIPDGLPISCFLSTVFDTKESLVEVRTENNWMSMSGGGIGTGFFNRSPDQKSTGVMAHLSGYNSDVTAYKQSSSRRGSIAAYLNIYHPEIQQFLKTRNPTSGGDRDNKNLNIFTALTIPDSFMVSMVKGEDIELVDPKHGKTGVKINARELWEKIISERKKTGTPYIMFSDTVNRNLNEWIMNPNYTVLHSNLCSEILEYTSETRTAVCCLSSLNAARFDEWKDTDLVSRLTRFLDNVIEFFIRVADKKKFSKSINSAKKERALGMGLLGFHSYLQKNNIAFESGGFNSAVQKSSIISKTIRSQAMKESHNLALERGCPEDTDGSSPSMRNTQLTAIAPNASSGDLANESHGIEPYSSNYYACDGRAGVYIKRNKYLEKLLESKDMNTNDVWKSILDKDGSVQHLSFLSEHEKNVFKTFKEINPKWIIENAAVRQEYVCQGQSLNIYAHKDITLSELSDLHYLAWIKGIKTLYYCRGEKQAKASTDNKTSQNVVDKFDILDDNTCLGCDG